jgi:uncharacterized DUF497 family protein
MAEIRVDEANVDDIARHNDTPAEVEEVFGGSHNVRKVSQDRYAAFGHTEDERMTTVIFQCRRGAVRVITAREMTGNECRVFRRK